MPSQRSLKVTLLVPLATTTAKSISEVESLRQLLREARFRFSQEAMYLEFHRVHFEEVR
jgi:hypothetical protein